MSVAKCRRLFDAAVRISFLAGIILGDHPAAASRLQVLEEPDQCCCREGRCSAEAMAEDAHQQISVDSDDGFMCCKIKESGWLFGGCPITSGYKIESAKQLCEPATVHTCSARLLQWMKDDQWYKLVPGWEAFQELYENYIPCMTPVDEHVLSVLTNTNVKNNPLRTYILGLPECIGLSDEAVTLAGRSSYDEMCPFGLAHKPYQPDFIQQGTCSFDTSDNTIHLGKSSMCVEGHRCTCPIFAVGKALKESLASSIQKGTMGTESRGILVGPRLESMWGQVKSASEAAASLSSSEAAVYPWPLDHSAAGSLTHARDAAGSAVMALTGAHVDAWAQSGCQKTVGCFPMDCVHVTGIGCRIRAPDDLEDGSEDERNPFWFMPPPTYECSYEWEGHAQRNVCGLRPCSRRNMLQQMVGTTSALLTVTLTSLHNCQPLLVEDMSASQRVLLENRTADLKMEYDALKIRNYVQREFHASCPWVVPLTNTIRCADGSSFGATQEGQVACDEPTPHGGIAQCPMNFPIMCVDGTCDYASGNCEYRGGPKLCPEAEASACPWLLPTQVERYALCADGSFSEHDMGRPTCQGKGQGGIRRCPWDRPLMCAEKKCNGDYCCETDCRTYGGPRPCNAN